jgi:hypothetical protein
VLNVTSTDLRGKLLEAKNYPNVRLGAARTVAELGIHQHDADTISACYSNVGGRRKMFDFRSWGLAQLSWSVVPGANNTVFPADMALSYFGIATLLCVEGMSRRVEMMRMRFEFQLPLLVLGLTCFLVLGTFRDSAFIYFQF